MAIAEPSRSRKDTAVEYGVTQFPADKGRLPKYRARRVITISRRVISGEQILSDRLIVGQFGEGGGVKLAKINK